ncbi:PREDICTED: leucine-rich repeat-containing protein 25, partial [Acanthisitta chloris]|uniref:leucine-rich repeat-containing protein 25 n=1 Tax=Acanthisitta chloris TaxID=57068 RepID=UPI0004F0EB57
LDLTNSSCGCAELDWSPFQQQRQLYLAHNGIKALSPSSYLGPRLEYLDLAYNQLKELPQNFFTNATKLQTLLLQGNPLRSVPSTAFHTLHHLTVSCHCDLLGTILTPCAQKTTQCLCLTSSQDSFNVTEFHGRECGASAALVGGVVGAVAAVVVLVAVGVAGVWYQRRRAGASGTGWGKQDPGAALRQPRYISRDTGMGNADGTNAPDYENVFVSPGTAQVAAQGWVPGWQEQSYSPQIPVDDNYFLESEADPGDQPIYANSLQHREDIYIIPDE